MVRFFDKMLLTDNSTTSESWEHGTILNNVEMLLSGTCSNRRNGRTCRAYQYRGISNDGNFSIPCISMMTWMRQLAGAILLVQRRRSSGVIRFQQTHGTRNANFMRTFWIDYER